MRAVALLGAICVCSGGQATVLRNPAACLEVHDEAKRLTCLDEVLGYKPPERKAEDQPKPKPWVAVTVRQSADFTNFAGADLVDKPGQLNLQRSDGEDSSVVKLAAIAVFRPVNDLGWQPFGAVAWNRDTSGSKPKDLRDLSVGIVGPLWDAADSGWTLFPTLRATHRVDRFGTSDANSLGLHVNVVNLSWVTVIPDAKTNTFSFVPQFGYVAEKRNGGGADEGNWRSGYVGFEASVQLNRVLPRLSTSVGFRRFGDQSVPDGSVKRRVNHTIFSLTYALTDPEDTSALLRPSILLSREVGTDVLGGDATNKTVLGLGIKFN